MLADFQIGVIIATSFQRTELLFTRSLTSVLKQTRVPDYIVIVCDNEDEKEFAFIRKRSRQLNNPILFCIRNQRTAHHSGTGAWNSGADFLRSRFLSEDKSYIAILDDDDEWADTYLETCAYHITAKGVENTNAVFPGLLRIHKDFELPFAVSEKDLTVQKFLEGNPGVQCSNMFFKTSSFQQTGGFDETLKSCADRDLMIHFLWKNPVEKIAFVSKILVFHHAEASHTVTNTPTLKWSGLDSFYHKYLHMYTLEMLEKSLLRTEKYFSYPHGQKIKEIFKNMKRERIVIAMPMRNAVETIRRAVLSVVNQKNTRRDITLIIGNDHSSDNSLREIQELLTENITIINIDGGNSYRARNAINEYILANMKDAGYIGRLDADDELADETVISKLEAIMDRCDPDVIVAGNYQRKDGVITGKNIPDRKLLDSRLLLERLYNMSRGSPEAELPSCNIFVKPAHLIRYPEKESAEDHWFTVELLLKQEELNIHIAHDLIYSIYSLSGTVTESNRKKKAFLKSRKELYENAKQKLTQRSIL